MLKRSAHVKKLSFVFSINLLVLLAAARGQNVATAAVPKQLTIEQIFAEGGLTGRGSGDDQVESGRHQSFFRAAR
jgi:hypothetical protein